MVADTQPRDRAPAARVENVELLVGVVQRVKERTVRRRAQPRDRGLILLRAVQRVADARFLPAAVVPSIENLDVAALVARAVRHVDAVAFWREREAAPRLLHLERGDFLLGRQINDVERVVRIAGIGEGEELAVGAYLAAEDHVSRRELPARRRRLPAAHQQCVRSVRARDRYFLAGGRMLDAERLESAPGGASQDDNRQGQEQAFH